MADGFAGPLLGAAALALGLALIRQRRPASQIAIYALQSWTLAARAAGRAGADEAMTLGLAALIVAGVQGTLLPIGLSRWFGRHRAAAPGPPWPLVLGALLIGLAVLLVTPASPVSARPDLVLSLAVTLLGGVAMTVSRPMPGPLIGLMAMQNGVILAGLGTVDWLPVIAPLGLGGIGGLLLVGLRGDRRERVS